MPTIYESVTGRIISIIEQERTVPWCRPWQSRLPANALTGRLYRGVNSLILSCTNNHDSRWLTFSQALSIGGHVRKGEKATQIMLWRFDDDSEQEQGQSRGPLVRAYSVFNVGQCENLNLVPLSEEKLSVEPLAAANQLLRGYVGGPLVVHGGDQACYIPSKDQVQMPPVASFSSGEGYFSTLAHELAHSTGAAHRLCREGITSPIFFASECYAEEELLAEVGSAFLSAEFGVPNTVQQSAAYIDGWLDALRRDRSLIVKAAGKAQKATDWILGRRL